MECKYVRSGCADRDGAERNESMKNIAPGFSSDTFIWVIKSIILLKHLCSMRGLNGHILACGRHFRVLKRKHSTKLLSVLPV